MLMRLDLNVTDSARNLHELKALIQTSCWLYLRTVVHFQLHQQLRLNSTAFRFQVRGKICSVSTVQSLG